MVLAVEPRTVESSASLTAFSLTRTLEGLLRVGAVESSMAAIFSVLVVVFGIFDIGEGVNRMSSRNAIGRRRGRGGEKDVNQRVQSSNPL